MDTLPPLLIAGRQGWLPLSPGTGKLFLRALATACSAGAWHTALRNDPALASWALAQPALRENLAADDANADPKPTLHELATCMAESPESWIDWPDSSSTAQPDPARDDWQTQALIDASQKCAGNWNAILTTARGWLRDDAGQPFAPNAAETKWLDNVWGTNNGDPTKNSNDPSVDEKCDLKNLREYWQDDDSAFIAVLPAIAMKLKRANEIAGDFSNQLESAKIAAMKELAYGASHEINNPLANISSRAQTLLMDEKDPYRQKALAAIVRQAFRAHEMIADMMLFAHPPRLEYSEFALPELIDEVLNELSADAERQSTRIVQQSNPTSDVGDDSSIQITADRVQIGAAIKALVRNSIEALGEGGSVRVETTRLTVPNISDPAKHLCVISVYDDGPGMTEKIRRHLFEPFFSGREAGRGLGFGISKVWRIAEQHGGSVAVSTAVGEKGSDPNQETCVSLQLPMQPVASATSQPRPS